MKEVFVVIPAYNEGKKILETIQAIKSEGFENLVIVDDGSKDDTLAILKNTGVFYASHPINRGAGAATQTGFDFALKLGAEIVVTIDADGQHNPAQIKKLVKALEDEKIEAVIGSRFLESQKIPFIRKVFNKIGNFVTWFFFGAYITDSQSGFKAFKKSALKKFEIESNGFEFCSEIVQKLHANKINFTEVPISVVYTEYSQSKGQSFLNGIKTVLKLALHTLMR